MFAIFAPLVSGLFAGITSFFSSLFGSGVKIFVRLTLRVFLIAVFAGVIVSVLDYFLNRLRDYSFTGMSPCMAHLMNVLGFFPSLNIFVQIIAIGFFAKFMIHYFKDSF